MIWVLAVVLIILGLFLIVRGLMEDDFEPFEDDEFEIEREEKKARVKTGGVVLIGPIPIVFGDSKYAFYTLILAIVLMLLSLILFLGVGL